MNQDKYIIQFDWRNPQGQYTFCQYWSSNSLLKFLFKFVVLSVKYEIIDVQYRNFKE